MDAIAPNPKYRPMENNSDEALKNIAPLLSEMQHKRKQHFTVPTHYFEQLPDVVLEKVQKIPVSIQKQPNHWQKIGYAMAVAATMSGLFFGWKQLQPVAAPIPVLVVAEQLPTRNETIALFSDEDIYEYVHKNIHEVEDPTWETLLTEEDMEIAYFLDDTDIILDVTDDFF
jgi:hypothetical protein